MLRNDLDPAFEQHARLIAARVYQLLQTSPAPVTQEYLATGDAAAFLGLSPKTLEAYRQPAWKGDPGPKYRRQGHRIIRYKVSDLVAWMDQTVEARAS